MGGKFAVLKRFRARRPADGTALIVDRLLFARRRRDEVFCFRTLHPGMRRGGNYARLNVRRIVVADALLLTRCCASRSLRLRPFAPAVPRGGNFFLCFQDGTADGALFAVRQTRLRTSRRLPGDHLERMIGLFHRHLLAAEFFFANRAVDDFFIRALRRASCGDLVFLDRLSRRMGGGDDFLFREDDAADGALAAFRKAGLGTSRFLPGDGFGRMIFFLHFHALAGEFLPADRAINGQIIRPSPQACCVDNVLFHRLRRCVPERFDIIVDIALPVFRAGIGRISLLRTSRRGYDGFVLMHMLFRTGGREAARRQCDDKAKKCTPLCTFHKMIPPIFCFGSNADLHVESYHKINTLSRCNILDSVIKSPSFFRQNTQKTLPADTGERLQRRINDLYA